MTEQATFLAIDWDFVQANLSANINFPDQLLAPPVIQGVETQVETNPSTRFLEISALLVLSQVKQNF